MKSEIDKTKIELAEMLELIPKMQKAVQNGLKVHFNGLDDLDHTVIPQKLEPLRKGIEILDPKYCLDIIFCLSQEDKSLFFNELKHMLPYVNATTLSDRLKKLEKNGVVERHIFPQERPIRVSYNLSEFGYGIFRLLLPLLVFISYYEKLKT
jgi:DNA-binding HxlR family transcriptional regulator